MVLSLLKSAARKVRDQPAVVAALSLPLLLVKRAGVTVPRRLYERLPFRGDFTLSLSSEGESCRVRSHGHSVENGLYWEGLAGFEAECMGPWMQFARRSGVILDIGANTGMYSMIAHGVSPRAEIHAFEPVSRIAALMRTNVSLNPGARIFVHELAVGAENGSANIFDPGGDNAYSASMNADFLDGEKQSYPVKVTTIDSFVQTHAITTVDLIKLDVEGFEEFALAGMWKTLQAHRPPMFLEFLDARKSDGPLVQKIGQLLDMGYRLYQILPDGIRLSDTIEAAPKGTYNVLLCVPERLPASLKATLKS